jgi:hypothetical protein
MHLGLSGDDSRLFGKVLRSIKNARLTFLFFHNTRVLDVRWHLIFRPLSLTGGQGKIASHRTIGAIAASLEEVFLRDDRRQKRRSSPNGVHSE